MTAYDRCIRKLDTIIERFDEHGIYSRGLLSEIRESNRSLRFHLNVAALATALIIVSAPLIIIRMF